MEGKERDKMKNIIFMGTPDFAVGTLEALIESKYTVQAVFTQPDKPKGRGKNLQMTPVKEVAVKAGIPVYQPRRIREPENLEILKQYQPDAIVVVAFGQIIPREILELAPYGCINVHASLLPKYRGAAPIQWAVIDGEKESGVTTMHMDEGVDTGDMILKEVVPLAEDETGGSLFDKLSRTGAKLLIRTLEALEEGTARPEKQPVESPTPYAAMLKKEMGRIDWTKPAAAIECLIRGLNPWPSAYTMYNGKTLKIWAADVEEEAAADGAKAHNTEAAGVNRNGGADGIGAENSRKDGEILPGTILEVTKKTLKIQTGRGILSVKELQLEGKKRMETDAFLRGFQMHSGELLV